MKVWVVIQDDGNSQEAEESVESVWFSRRKALDRSHEVSHAMRQPSRVEAHKVRVKR